MSSIHKSCRIVVFQIDGSPWVAKYSGHDIMCRKIGYDKKYTIDQIESVYPDLAARIKKQLIEYNNSYKNIDDIDRYRRHE